MNTNNKREELYNYIREQGTVDQPTITKYFHEKFSYNNMNTARVGISRMLRGLEEDGRIKKKTVMNDNSGSIDKNVWRVQK